LCGVGRVECGTNESCGRTATMRPSFAHTC
jgi:hypothetical protein